MNQATSKQSILHRTLSTQQIFVLILLSLIFLVYIPFFFGMYNLRQEQIVRGISPFGSLPVLGIDSYEYAVLAQNLVTDKVFSLDTNEPFKPETFRTIGYPGFLALYLARGLPLVAFPIIQIILTALTAYVVYVIGKTFWRPAVGSIAGILFVLDPITLTNTLTISTDVLYVFLIVCSFYFFFVSKLDSRLSLKIAGLLLGVSTLVRPISMFLLCAMCVLYLLKTYIRKESWKKASLSFVMCCVVYAAVVAPWVIRNKKVTGVMGVSTVKSYNLYHYYVPEFLSYKKGITTDAARLNVGEGLGIFDERSLSNASKMESRAMEIIFKQPFSYGVFHLIKMIPFFISSGVETLFTNYNDASGEEVFPTIKENMTGLLLKGKVGELLRIVKSHPVIAAEQVILVGLWSLAVLAFYVGYKRKDVFRVLLLWFVIFYFAVLTGPVAYSRYRLPVTPFLFLLATYAIVVRSYATPHNHPETR